MKILIAEDEPSIASAYKLALEPRGHGVTITSDGEECLDAYRRAITQRTTKVKEGAYIAPFDAALLDYRMPKKDGLEVAKEILAVEPRQRIIFASAYVRITLEESVKELGMVVELLQKPFSLKSFIDTLEDTEIFDKIKAFNANAKNIQSRHLNHDQINDLLAGLRVIMKEKTF